MPHQHLLSLIKIVEFEFGGGLGRKSSVVGVGDGWNDKTASGSKHFIVLPSIAVAYRIFYHINKMK